MKPKHYRLLHALLLVCLVIAVPAVAHAAAITMVVDNSLNAGSFSSIAVVNSNPAISYYDSIMGDLKYVRATNANGTAWGTPVVVDAAEDTGATTSLAVVNGNPAISYFDYTNVDLWYVRAIDANGTAWGAPIIVDAVGSVGSYASLAVVNGNPAISYYDSTNGDLKYVRAIDASGSAWGAPVIVDGLESVGSHTSLEVIDGNPAISYHDSTNGDLKYVRATDASGSAWGAPVTVDAVGITGRYTSMAVVNGNPAISYYDSTSDDLKYVRATDASGSAWGAPVTVDMVGNTGVYTSLAVASGSPAISYYDASNGDLKYVRASDASGSAWQSPMTVDGDGTNTGGNPSLVVVEDQSIISYYNMSGSNLKVAVLDSDYYPPTLADENIDAVYASGPSSFSLTFSEAVRSDGSTQAANHTGNYRLFEAGANHAFDTVDCAGGVQPDDTAVSIQSAAYDAGALTVELAFNHGEPLPPGSYRLLVCGSTSIYDLAGNELNDGADTVIDFTVSPTPSPTAVPAPDGDPTVLPATGFARGRAAQLPPQPAEKAYASTEMTLEIPALGVELPITGVPQVDAAWDVSWLGGSAGYLEGSAYPTWEGNSVLTGHVWDAFNQPGPFAELKNLRYGERVFIHAYGQTYVYEVRQNELISRRNVAAVFAHEESDWVTLVTCELYNPFTEDYFFRRIVRAVLVDVQ
jgi:LPXTG-site transpeptidase (sortase) family protein